MYEVGKTYKFDEDTMTVESFSNGLYTVTYMDSVISLSEEEMDALDLKEDVVMSSPNIEQGLKTQYMKTVLPKYPTKKMRSPLREALGCYVDRADISEEKYVEYDSYTKIATLYESGEESTKLRCTNSDWKMFSDEVVDNLIGGQNNGD